MNFDPAANRHQRRAQGKRQRLPTRAEARAATDRHDAEGCARCGAFTAGGLPWFVVRTPGGRVECRCIECRDAGDAHACLVGVCADVSDRWSQLDRAWFLAHPDRQWRIRPPMAGEINVTMFDNGLDTTEADLKRQLAPGTSLAVIVHQHRPGVRQRVFAYSDQPLGSFTEQGIAKLAERALAPMPVTEEETHALLRERFARRCAVTKPFVKPAGEDTA